MEGKKMFIQIILTIAFVYIAIGLFLYLKQGSIVYYPDNQDFDSCPGFSDYQKMDFNGTRFYYLEQSKDVIVFYHGNAGSACDRSFLKEIFQSSGKSIIFVEYAGYSNDSQRPTIKLILQDVDNITNFIKQEHFQNITVIGGSLGTGPASYHTSTAQVDNLLLLTAFSNTAHIARDIYPIYPTSIILKEKYNNVNWLKDYNNNLLIIHGAQDQVVPIKFGRRLYDSLSTAKKEFFTVTDMGHNNIWSSNQAIKKITEFINL